MSPRLSGKTMRVTEVVGSGRREGGLPISQGGVSNGRGTSILPLTTSSPPSPPLTLRLLLLTALYTCQGLPVGLTLGAIPFLLSSSGASYAQLATVSLAIYPYSLKVAWSPLVDVVRLVPCLGPRQSWIIPPLGLSLLLWGVLTVQLEGWLQQLAIGPLTLVLTGLMLAAATMDIAVDAWSLQLLPLAQRHWQASTQSVGLSAGACLSFPLFLAGRSPEFGSRWLGLAPDATEGAISIQTAMLCATVLTAIPLGMLLLWRQHLPDEDLEGELQSRVERSNGQRLRDGYIAAWSLIRLQPIRELTLLLLFSRFAMVAMEGMLPMVLLSRGYLTDGAMAELAVLQFPVDVIVAVIAVRLARNDETDENGEGSSAGLTSGCGCPVAHWLQLWKRIFTIRLLFCPAWLGLLLLWPLVPESYAFWLTLSTVVLRSLLSNAMFLIQGSIFASVSDPSIAATTMTLLNSVANAGSVWPYYAALQALSLLPATFEWGSWGSMANTTAITLVIWPINVVVAMVWVYPLINALGTYALAQWHLPKQRGGNKSRRIP
jgi:MFS transporter, PAT family, solute carrier family 33 (acetyl-CoA transportor), member 1